MATIKRYNESGMWEFLELAGQDVTTLQTQVNTNTISLAQIATLDVKSFGAKGDGVTDDTSAIQTALSYNTSGRLRYIKIPDGTYMVNPYTKLKLSSNTKLEFSQNAVLKAINTNQDISSMLDVRNVNNIEIINPTIIGDRDTNTMNTAGAGHGITCINVTNLIIRGGNISKCFTDGIYLNGITNGLIDYVTSDNNRRQGMSITSNIKNLNVRNSSFTNSNGTAPMMGIDIEPNGANDYLSNIRLENIYTSGNLGSGIGVNLNQLDNVNTIVDIVIDQWTDNGSTKGLIASKFSGNISSLSTIKVNDLKANNNLDCGINVVGYKADGNPKLSIVRPRIYNCNVNNGTNERSQNVAISINAETTGYPAGTDQGNVEIIEPHVDMASGRTILRAIYIGYGANYKKILVKNPTFINIGGTTLSQNNTNNLLTFSGTSDGNVRVFDKYGSLALTSNYSLIRNFSAAYYSKYIATNTGSATLQDWINWNCVVEPILVINKVTEGTTFNVKLITGVVFLDESNVDQQGKTYSTTNNGAVLKFEKLDDNLFKVTKIRGTWSVA